MTMIAISLPFIVAYSLLVSGVLAGLNKTGIAAVASAAVTLAICLATGAVLWLETRNVPAAARVFSLWSVSVLVPSAVVFGVSRLDFARARPWSLMLVGPLSFVVGMVVAMTAAGILLRRLAGSN